MQVNSTTVPRLNMKPNRTAAIQPARPFAAEKPKAVRDVDYATWSLVVVTAVLAIYTYRLWKATNTLAKDAKASSLEQSRLTLASIDEMRRVADAAMRSADVARDTLHIAHRAHLHIDSWAIDDFQLDRVPVVRFDVLNRGRTAAKLVGFRAAYDDADPPPVMPEYHEDIKPKHGLVRPSDRAVTEIRFQAERPPSREAFEAVASSQHPVYVWGEVVYEDIFGDVHRTGFGIELWINRNPEGGWNSFPIDKPGYNYAD